MITSASLKRRLLALTIDWWVISFPIMALIVPRGSSASLGVHLLVCIAEITTMTYFAGGSLGQVLLKIRIRDFSTGERPELWRVFVRTVLIFAVLPAIFVRGDRGYHDVIAGTEVVKLVSA